MVCWPHNYNMHETQTGVCQDWQAVSLCPSAYKVYATQLRFQLPLTNYNMSLFHWRYALRSVLLRKVTVAEGPYTSLVARHVDIGIENCLAATGGHCRDCGVVSDHWSAFPVCERQGDSFYENTIQFTNLSTLHPLSRLMLDVMRFKERSGRKTPFGISTPLCTTLCTDSHTFADFYKACV